MSKLQDRKTKLVLTTEDTHGHRHKAVMLELKPTFAYVWLAGTRTRLQISYASIYEHAAWIAARNAQLEKARARKENKKKRKA